MTITDHVKLQPELQQDGDLAGEDKDSILKI